MNRFLDKVVGWIPGASSLQVRDALRLALQSSIAAALVWVLMEWLELPERFVGVLSAALVMKATVGSTLVAGKQRVVATIVGCALGIACLFAIPHGYGTAVAIAIPIAVVSLVAGFKPEWSYGIVGAIALAIGADSDLIQVALDRTISIALGVVVGIVCALVLFPEKSSIRTERHLRLALKTVGVFLDKASTWIKPGDNEDLDEVREKFGTHMAGARESVSGVNLADSELLRDKIKWVDRLFTSAVILKRVGERGVALDQDGDQVTERYSDLVNKAKDLAERLAREESESEDKISEMDSGLKSLEQAVRDNPEDEGVEEEQRTLAFAMKEVNDSMKKLSELYSLQEQQ